jgi:oligoribonuclease NrnB/cAMP/cGMP phosphodiesterase (DHH superfamily)
MTDHIVFYHKNCADGFGAAWAAWKKFGDRAEYRAVQYGEAVHPADMIDLVSGRDVHILDFSFPRPVMELIFTHADHVTWLDHHKTAFEMWGVPSEQQVLVQTEHTHGDAGNPVLCYIKLDMNQSGALLAWKHYSPNEYIPSPIIYIDDHDRWQFKHESTKQFHAGLMASKPWSFEQWDMMRYDYSDIISDGSAILKAQDAIVAGLVNSAAPCWIGRLIEYLDEFKQEKWIDRLDGLVINSCLYQSELGHELATTSGTFGLVWFMDKDGAAICSLRSNGDYDVSAIAKALGGGGHRNAAGFRVDLPTISRITLQEKHNG